MPSLVHLRLWLGETRDRLQLWYGVMGLAAGLYIVCTVLLYGSLDVEAYRTVLRVQTWFTPLFLLALLEVARTMAGSPRRSLLERLLQVFLVVEPFARLLDPWTFIYTNVTGLGARTFAWGETIAVLRAGSHDYGAMLVSGLFLVCIVFLVGWSWSAWRSGRTSAAAILLVSSLLLLGGGIVDTVIVVAVLPLPFVSEPALAGIVLLMGWKLQQGVFEAGRMRREMEAGRSVLATLVEHASDLVLRVDPRGIITWASPSIQSFTGVRDRDSVGRFWIEFAEEGRRDALERALDRLRAGEEAIRESYRMLRSGGGLRWVETIARAHRDPEGVLLEIHCVTRDVDDARGREEKLAKLEADLRESNATLEHRVQERTRELHRSVQDLEAFAATASHDLRAPLRVMAGYATALGEDHGRLLPEEGRDWLARIHVSATRLGNLIESLLRLARTGQRALERMDTDLSGLAAEVATSLRAAHPGVAATLAIEPGLRAHCDPVLAHNALENLFDNAWKYSSKADRIAIDFGRDPATGWFFLRDQGAGFDMLHAEQLFQSFQRLHRSDEFEGNGIGLASVRRILERHGGAIRAESSPGSGATFFFHFGDLPAG
jgi:PAS domain S-box-containing protein